MNLHLTDKVVLVTGGSSGIGFETVRQFLQEGARVVSCARGTEALRNSAEILQAEGFGEDRLLIQTCDVLDIAQVEALAAAAKARFGRLDILVLNAGQRRISTFANTRDEDWEAEYRLKIFSVVRPIRAVLPMLQASAAASIVIVNSLLSLQPEPHMVCTSSARAGVQNLAKSLSIEFAPEIRVNTVLLGLVNSGQWARQYETAAKPGQTMDDWLCELARDKHIPAGRIGRPEEPASAIVFLASPLCGFTTGASLEVSGGVSRFT